MSGEGRRINVYAISRELWDHPIFADEPFTEAQAWAWLVGQAAWKDGPVRGNTGQAVELKRSEFSMAIRYMAERWRWSKDRAHRFLKKLEKAQMLRDASRDSFQIYSICNYNRFQVVGVPKCDSDETQPATAARQQRDKRETGKQVNRKQEGGAPLIPGLEFPPWWPKKAWEGYMEVRRRKRADATPHAIEIIVRKLTEWRAKGHDPEAILEKSILNNWTGVFEPDRPGRKPDLFSAPVVAELTSVDGWVERLEVYHGMDPDWPEGKWPREWGPEDFSLVPPEALDRFYAKHPQLKRRRK